MSDIVEEEKKDVIVEPEKTYTHKEMRSIVDREVLQGVNTYKTGKFETAVDNRVKEMEERKAHKTPEQMLIEDLQKELKEEKNIRLSKEEDALTEQNKTFAMNLLSKSGLPTDLALFTASSNKESSDANVQTMISSLTDFLKTVNQKTIDNSTNTKPEFSKTENKTVNKPPENATKAEMKDWFKNNR